MRFPLVDDATAVLLEAKKVSEREKGAPHATLVYDVKGAFGQGEGLGFAGLQIAWGEKVRWSLCSYKGHFWYRVRGLSLAAGGSRGCAYRPQAGQ